MLLFLVCLVFLSFFSNIILTMILFHLLFLLLFYINQSIILFLIPKRSPILEVRRISRFLSFFPTMSTVSPEENLKKYMSKLYSCVFSYQTANSLILPIVPYLATSMNATNTQYSLSFTVYYIAQLIGKFRSSLIK